LTLGNKGKNREQPEGDQPHAKPLDLGREKRGGGGNIFAS